MVMIIYQIQPARAAVFPAQIHPRRRYCFEDDGRGAGYIRLARAIVSSALIDALKSRDRLRREDARAWLLESGAEWASWAGMPITGDQICQLASSGWKPKNTGA